MGTIFNRRIKYLCYLIELLVLYILQNTPALLPEIFSVKPMLVLCGIISISFLEDEIPSMIFGMIGGLLIDLSFGNYFGLFGMIMAIICCFTSVYIKNLIKINTVIIIKTAVISLGSAVLCDWIFRYVIHEYSLIFIILLDVFLPVFIYSMLCLPILYLINLGIYNALRYNEIF